MKKISEICKFSFLSCEQYTELLSRSFEQPLTFSERLKFWSHHFLCMVCRRFNRQIHFIEKASQQYEHCCDTDHPLGEDIKLSDKSKEKIETAIKNQQELS